MKNMSGALNVNGDDAATAIAISLQADELLLVSDVKGVRLQSGAFAQNLTSEQARELIDAGIASGGMAAKLESAASALASGIERVRICDPEGISSAGKGTYFTQSAGIV
jgi:acetylglutamate kinase